MENDKVYSLNYIVYTIDSFSVTPIFLIQGGLYKCYYVGVYCWLAITLELLKGILRNNE